MSRKTPQWTAILKLTCLTTLTKTEKQALLNKELVLVKDNAQLKVGDKVKGHNNYIRQVHLSMLEYDEFISNNNVIICGDFNSNLIWERTFSPINLKKHFSSNHDFIICFAKNIESLICNGLERGQEGLDRYKNPDEDPRGLWQSDNFSVGPAIDEKIYEITTPSGRKILPPSGRCWLLTRERFEELITNNF